VTTTVAEMRHMHQLSMLCYKRISDLEKAIYTANEVQKGKMVQLKDKYRHLMNALQECDCKATAQQELAIANAGKEFASLFEEKK
jgi:CTP-dependent riboflavin kinase